MLNIEDAIREENRLRRIGKPYHVFVFLCLNCRSELYVQPNRLKLHLGFCRSCRLPAQREPFRPNYNKLVSQAKHRKISCILTYEEYLTFTELRHCYYCGLELQWISNWHGNTNVDRKDNDKGYESGNLVPCCANCNLMRGRCFTVEEFRAVMKLLKIMRNPDPNKWIIQDLTMCEILEPERLLDIGGPFDELEAFGL